MSTMDARLNQVTFYIPMITVSTIAAGTDYTYAFTIAEFAGEFTRAVLSNTATIANNTTDYITTSVKNTTAATTALTKNSTAGSGNYITAALPIALTVGADADRDFAAADVLTVDNLNTGNGKAITAPAGFLLSWMQNAKSPAD